MSEKKNNLVEIVVLKAFRDKNDNKIRYDVDTKLEFDAERAADVVERGLAKYTEEQG